MNAHFDDPSPNIFISTPYTCMIGVICDLLNDLLESSESTATGNKIVIKQSTRSLALFLLKRFEVFGMQNVFSKQTVDVVSCSVRPEEITNTRSSC